MTRLTAALLALVAAALAAPAFAEDFPTGPVTIVNPYSAGGPADLIARTVAEPMSKILGQPVVVENRPGAGTAIAASYVARSKPDGYTLFIGGSPSHVVTPALMKEADYDGIKDFAPVASVAVVPNVLVVPADRPYKTVDELVAAAKKADGNMTFGSVGIGSLPQFLGVLLQQRAGIKLTHVPYKGAAPTVVDLLAGNVDMAFLNVPPVLGHVRDGKLVALAVANSQRSPQLPDVPTMAEAGYDDFVMSTWYGISAPAGTPADVVAKLDDAIKQATAMDEVKQKLGDRSVEVFYQGHDEFSAFLKKDADRMLNLIEVAGMKPH